MVCLNILIGKYKCFENTFHVSGILFTNKLNSGCYIRVDKIFGTIGSVGQVVVLCSVNTTKYYLGGLRSFKKELETKKR